MVARSRQVRRRFTPVGDTGRRSMVQSNRRRSNDQTVAASAATAVEAISPTVRASVAQQQQQAEEQEEDRGVVRHHAARRQETVGRGGDLRPAAHHLVARRLAAGIGARPMLREKPNHVMELKQTFLCQASITCSLHSFIYRPSNILVKESGHVSTETDSDDEIPKCGRYIMWTATTTPHHHRRCRRQQQHLDHPSPALSPSQAPAPHPPRCQ